MQVVKEKIPLILLAVMTVGFYYFTDSWFVLGKDVSLMFVLEDIDNLPIAVKRIIATIFFALMCRIVMLLTESEKLPYVYMGIIIIGTLIAKENFLFRVILVMGIPGYLMGAFAEFFTSIITFLFPGFSGIGIWIVRAFQMMGHLMMVTFLSDPLGFFVGMEENTEHKTKNYNMGSAASDFMKDWDDISREQREREMLETIKDIDYELKNRRR